MHSEIMRSTEIYNNKIIDAHKIKNFLWQIGYHGGLICSSLEQVARYTETSKCITFNFIPL